ncbi:MmgE/PrpD family protein [Achromobacter aloeverae]|uniref:MmgE/PrpD family protein n=1 Tax=Achromobacter aloeverae TaxID=1750518 RepID=A0A4Q1HMX0_9BURK|nr:MmgE/PrpD family protein [Achromobacter aloeverae]RXN92229.1 MmgE/PrpD family protein [Achromobacter aloeverae]
MTEPTHDRDAAGARDTLLGKLARNIVAFDANRVEGHALARAKACIADTIGVMLAGAQEACARILLRVPGVAQAPGPCTILGTGIRTSALDATLVNGTSSHALDYDDISGDFGGHPSVPLVPLLLALGQERGGTGRDFLAAYAVGVETEIRLARAAHPVHYDKGWHPTATLGVFGAAAAGARYLKLDVARTTMALAIAGSLANGLKASFGTMTKPLHVGHCGRSGLFAALLASEGYEGAADLLEHHQGYFQVFNGAGNFNPDAVLQDWGHPLEIAGPTIGIKQFPCCGSTHASIAAALNLAQRHDLRAADVARIEIMPNRHRLKHTDKPYPASSLDAKFSVQYVVARALVSGNVRLRDFENDAYLEPEIQRLLGLTQAVPHPGMGEGGPQWGTEIIVTLKDGSRHAERIANMVSRDGSCPMSRAELKAKFDDCSQRVLPAGQADALFEQLWALEQVQDMKASAAWLQAGAA